MYKLHLTKFFVSRRDKLVKKDQRLAKKLSKSLRLLSKNPKHPSLKSHQVDAKHFGKCWSSWVTGNVRIIWDYKDEDTMIIILWSMGGHSGKDKVYN